MTDSTAEASTLVNARLEEASMGEGYPFMQMCGSRAATATDKCELYRPVSISII